MNVCEWYYYIWIIDELVLWFDTLCESNYLEELCVWTHLINWIIDLVWIIELMWIEIEISIILVIRIKNYKFE